MTQFDDPVELPGNAGESRPNTGDLIAEIRARWAHAVPRHLAELPEHVPQDIATLLAEVEQVTRERDAAISQIGPLAAVVERLTAEVRRRCTEYDALLDSLPDDHPALQQMPGERATLRQQIFAVAEARDVAQAEVERLRALLDGRPWTAWDTADRHRTRLATVLREVLVHPSLTSEFLDALRDEAVDALEEAGFPVAYKTR